MKPSINMEKMLTENQDIGKRYRIHWENTDGPGRGVSKNTYSLGEARKLANQLNADHPKIKHIVKPA